MSYTGYYKLDSFVFVNNIPNIHGTAAQRTFTLDGNDLEIAEGYYTITALTDEILRLIQTVNAGATKSFTKETKKCTYTLTSSLALTISDTLLQEVTGLSDTTGTSIASGYMNLCPFPYIGVALANFQPVFNAHSQDYTLHITSDAPYGSAVEYTGGEILLATGSDGSATFHSRGRTFTVPYYKLWASEHDPF